MARKKTRKQKKARSPLSVRGTLKAAEDKRRKRISAALKRYHAAEKAKKERRKQQRALKKEGKAPKLSPLPRGFKSIIDKDPRPGMRDSLAEAGAIMFARWGVSSDIRHAVNADKSIVYELRIAMSPSASKESQAFLTDLANSIRPVAHTWSTIGFRFKPKKITEEEREKYDRHKGTIQIQAYTQRTTSRHLVRLEATAEQILTNVKERKGWKPETCFVRVMWNESGERPKRKKNTKRS
jgi:hypothetical protein